MDTTEDAQTERDASSETDGGGTDRGGSAANQTRSEKNSADESAGVKRPKWSHDQPIGVKNLRDSLGILQAQVMAVVGEQQKELKKLRRVVKRFRR